MVLLQKTTFIFNLPSLQRGRFLYWRDTYNILNRQYFRELHCSVNVVKLRVDESAQRGDSLAVAEELEGTVLENVKVSFNYSIVMYLNAKQIIGYMSDKGCKNLRCAAANW